MAAVENLALTGSLALLYDADSLRLLSWYQELTVRRAHTADANADTDAAATRAVVTRMAATGGMAAVRTTTWAARAWAR